MLDAQKRLYKLYRLKKGANGKASVALYKGDVLAVITMTSDRRDVDNTVGAMLLKKRYIGVANSTLIEDGDILKRDGENQYYRIISCESKGIETYLHLETLALFPSEAFDFEEASNV